MAALYSKNGAIVRQVASFTGELKLVNIMPTTGVKVVDDNGYIGGDFLGVYYPSTNYYNNFAIQLVGADFSDKGLGQVTIVDTTATIGGRVYRTVTIGGITWMAENLDYKFSGCGIGCSGTPSTPNAWYYNNDESTYGVNGNKYGLLYNWHAVKYLNDNKDVLMPGWHVPTNIEFTALANAVGGLRVAGTKLKSTTGWSSGNGTDEFGFSAFPAGGRADGSFYWLGSVGRFWSSTQDSLVAAIYCSFESSDSIQLSSAGKTDFAFSVRLVKDSA